MTLQNHVAYIMKCTLVLTCTYTHEIVNILQIINRAVFEQENYK